MGEALKELGKTFYTIAVIVLTATVIHPWVKGKSSFSMILIGAFLFVALMISGFAFITFGEKLKNRED